MVEFRDASHQNNNHVFFWHIMHRTLNAKLWFKYLSSYSCSFKQAFCWGICNLTGGLVIFKCNVGDIPSSITSSCFLQERLTLSFKTNAQITQLWAFISNEKERPIDKSHTLGFRWHDSLRVAFTESVSVKVSQSVLERVLNEMLRFWAPLITI